ncbi:MAG TPA: hypothetical protein VD907_06490 [Verrucomicrobiae bacterium]|nr:hypothetical protein [Verrucomicrobiae bacterium]
MYHALVRRGDEWVSFGVHVPSTQWTAAFSTLQAVFGADSTAYTYLSDASVVQNMAALKDWMEEDVKLANQVQAGFDSGQVIDQSNNNPLAHGISQLRAP